MTARELWEEFSRKTGINADYDEWAFCGGGEIGDELAQLVLEGKKTATASAYIAYQTENEPLPQAGEYSVVLFDSGEAACIIRNVRVSLVPFKKVPAEHAYCEGEGDRSLEYWRSVHREAFETDYAAAGLPFDEDGLCVLEEFEPVYSGASYARNSSDIYG